MWLERFANDVPLDMTEALYVEVGTPAKTIVLRNPVNQIRTAEMSLSAYSEERFNYTKGLGRLQGGPRLTLLLVHRSEGSFPVLAVESRHFIFCFAQIKIVQAANIDVEHVWRCAWVRIGMDAAILTEKMARNSLVEFIGLEDFGAGEQPETVFRHSVMYRTLLGANRTIAVTEFR